MYSPAEVVGSTPVLGANGGFHTMGHGSNYITAFPKGRPLDVRFAGTVKVPLPAVCRGYPTPYRCGVFALSATLALMSKVLKAANRGNTKPHDRPISRRPPLTTQRRCSGATTAPCANLTRQSENHDWAKEKGRLSTSHLSQRHEGRAK